MSHCTTASSLPLWCGASTRDSRELHSALCAVPVIHCLRRAVDRVLPRAHGKWESEKKILKDVAASPSMGLFRSIMRLQSATYQEVFDTLRMRPWKSPATIKGEIAAVRRVPSYKIVVGSVYAHLERLEEQGYAEERERELTFAERLLRRRDSEKEYRLTPGGLRRREERYANMPSIDGLSETCSRFILVKNRSCIE